MIGFPALASTSMEQARRAVHCAFGAGSCAHGLRFLPAGVYTIPEVSMAGETETSLLNAGVEYFVGRADYGHFARGPSSAIPAAFSNCSFGAPTASFSECT